MRYQLGFVVTTCRPFSIDCLTASETLMRRHKPMGSKVLEFVSKANAELQCVARS